MKLPAGPGGAATDTDAVIAEATAACKAVNTFSAELGASGSVGKQRLRGRLLVGLAAPASARVEALAPFGQPVFIFVARDNDATLLLPRDDRVLEHGRPDAVLEAIAGVPLDGAALRATLSGCGSTAQGSAGRSLGPDWRVVTEGQDEVYVKREGSSSPWRVVAAVHGAGPQKNGVEWRAEYRDFQNGLPRSVRLISRDSGRFDLRFTLSQVEVNTALGADVFKVDIPRSARPMTIDELRDARPGLRQD
jgi:outer membrane lipoprotein-sorting protein